MSKNRVMVICLDAYDAAFSDKLIAQGKLPGLQRLKEHSARFQLEHGTEGKARYTGLTWEHFCSGAKPETSGKWSVICFDPKEYRAYQTYATETPFFAHLDAKCVVFDAPYFDLSSASSLKGAVGWSGHDTGVFPFSRPGALLTEITSKFGPPPDVHELNSLVYSSVKDTIGMGETLINTVRQRSRIIQWLYTERFPDWEVGLVAFSEPHDGIELLFHGIDPNHHLADFPSADAAREGLTGIYQAISEEIERLMDLFPDTIFVAFTMHGMGHNDTDVPTMLLLPELMYRIAFEQPLFRSRQDWKSQKTPVLRSGERWENAVMDAMKHPPRSPFENFPRRAAGKAHGIATKVLGADFLETINFIGGKRNASDLRSRTMDVDWMPAYQYSRYWPKMDAIAVPAYFDGRVRINLIGREKYGRVTLEQYGATLDKIEEILRECVDTNTGDPVVREITRPAMNSPMSLDMTQADLKILWAGSPVGFRHPTYGDIGPGPIRRAGGHSGGYGAMYICGGFEPGDYGLHSSFDVAPTIVDLLGARLPNGMDGKSVFRKSAVSKDATPELEIAE